MRRVYYYANTPLPLFLAVMGPICALMVFLLIVPQLAWVRASAAGVIGLSLYAALRGYVRRLRIAPDGLWFCTLAVSWHMPWRAVRRIDRYAPAGGVNSPKCVFITTRNAPPEGKSDIDARTFQLQDRPGLLETLHDAWRQATDRAAADAPQ